MTQHYVLTINPNTEYEWEKCTLRNPMTGEHPDLTTVIAQAVDNQVGTYLVAINIEVKILEKSPLPPAKKAPVELTSKKPFLAAS